MIQVHIIFDSLAIKKYQESLPNHVVVCGFDFVLSNLIKLFDEIVINCSFSVLVEWAVTYWEIHVSISEARLLIAITNMFCIQQQRLAKDYDDVPHQSSKQENMIKH